MMAISTGLSVAGTLYSAREQNKAHRENAEAANAAKIQEDQQIQAQQAQRQQDAAQQKIAATQDARVAAARARVAEGESGASLNNNAVVQNIIRQGLTANTLTEQNMSRANQQTQWDLQASANRAQSRINQVSKADPIATALQVGGQYVDYKTNVGMLQGAGINTDAKMFPKKGNTKATR